ncbi:Histidine protein kinase 1 [Meyerozyma sp. JA9]|nr:Histidine protein kinase 1 [Meyerozyma sp. JA9]
MNLSQDSASDQGQGLTEDLVGYATTLHDLVGSPDHNTVSADASTDRSDVNSSTGSLRRNARSVDLDGDAPSHSTDFATGASSNMRLSVTGTQSNSSNSSAQDVQAFTSYINNVDYVKNQNDYLSENLNSAQQRIPESTFDDHQLLESDSVAGYTLISQFEANVEQTTLLYRAVEIATNAPVLIRISPLIEDSNTMVRILNEWYILSGRNPPTQHRLWNNDVVENDFLKSHSRPLLGDKNAQRSLAQPTTLPLDVTGILYPIGVVNMSLMKEGESSRRMALIYRDKNYSSLFEYHSNSSSGADNSFDPTLDVLANSHAGRSSASVGGSTTTNVRSLGSGRSAFEEIYSKVKQSPQSPLKVVEVLGDIINVVKTLRTVHELGIVHNGLTSKNILKCDDGRVELSSWDFSFSVQPEDCTNGHRKRNSTNLMSILPYLSPEATGDMNKRVSYKSDFYALGVILYELTVGVLPFSAQDAAALIRMHLFQKPLAPDLLAPSWISPRLSKLILNLLEKEDSKRPTDAGVLLEELFRIKNRYIDEIIDKGGDIFIDYVKQNEHISRFLNKEETKEPMPKPPVFVLSEAVYGRNEEYRKIFTTTNRLTEGENVVLISGRSGYGKSVLLGDLRTSSIANTNFHCSWKFSKSDANISVYTVFISAISSIVKQILKSSKDHIDKWRDLIVTEIPLDLGVLFYLVPGLKHLLGPKYSTLHRRKDSINPKEVTSDEPLDDSDDANSTLKPIRDADYHNFSLELKYRYIVKAFLSLISMEGLTMFLDDIQWCSPGEISLLAETIKFVQTQNLSSGSSGYLKIIATMDSDTEKTYDTDFEASEDTLVDLFKISGAKVFEFKLKEISKDSFSYFLQSSLVIDSPYNTGDEVASFAKDETTSLSSMYGEQVSSISKDILKDEKVDSLSSFLYHHLRGNVLLTKYVLKTAFMEGKIKYRINRSSRRWDFDYSKFKIPANQGDIIANYLSTALTPEAMSLMKFAAITTEGHFFRLSELMIVANLGIKEVYKTVNLCVETGIVSPGGPFYKLPFHLMADSDFPVELTDTEIWNLASEAVYKFDHDSIQSAIISSLVQMNELEEYHRLCALRYFKKIRKETKYSISAYLTMASHFAKSWKIIRRDDCSTYFKVLVKAGRLAMSTYNLSSSLIYFQVADHFIRESDVKHKLRNKMTMCQIQYYMNNYNDCLKIIDESEAKYGLDKTRFVIFRVRSLIRLGRCKEGVKVAVDSLHYLGIDVEPEATLSEDERNHRFIGQIPSSASEIRAMKDLKLAKDKKVLLIYELISEILPHTFSTNNYKLRDSLVLYSVDMMLNYGISLFCAIPLLYLANKFAREYTEAGFIKALEYSKLALYWADKNDKNSIIYVQTVYELFVNTLAVYFEPLADVLKYYETFSSSLSVYSRSKNIKLDSTTNAVKVHLLLLSGAPFHAVFPSWTNNKFAIEDNSDWNQLLFKGLKMMQGAFSLEDFEKQTARHEPNPDILFISKTCKLYYLTVKNRVEESVRIVVELMEDYIPQIPLTLLHVEFYFIAGIALCQEAQGIDSDIQREMLHEIVGRVQLFAQFSPSTFKGKYLILKAMQEANLSKSSSLEILDSFEDAIQVSKRSNNWYDVAWGTYLCALWLMKTNSSAKRTSSFAEAALVAFKSLDVDLLVDVVESRLGSYIKKYNWAGVESIEEPQNHSSKPLSLILSRVFTSPLPRSKSISKANHEPQDKAVSKISNDSVELRETVKACLMISESTSQDDIVIKLLETTVFHSKVDFGAVVLNSQGDACVKAIGSSNSVISLDNEPLSSRTDLCPFSLLVHVLYNGKVVNKDEDRIFFNNNFGQDEYYKSNRCDSVICIPLKNDEGVFGAVYLEKAEVGNSATYFDCESKDLLTLLCSQAAVSLAKASLYDQMAFAKRAAENATAEKASFLANMSHEIRTPFNSLLSCSLFLLDTELNNTQKEYVETIKTSAMLTLNIIDGILAFSKLEHGSFTLENAPFSLNDCIESAIQIIGESASVNDLDLAFFNKCPLIDTVIGDVTRFRQIIINLLGNAVKFTSKGHITVTLDSNQINESRYEFEICVEDTGVGIPKKSQNKVFGAFSQVDASSRRSFGGSGLGLAISKKLADLMGGTLTFSSDEGVGTKFFLNVKAQVHEFKEPEIFVSDEIAAKRGINNKALILDNHRLGSLALQETLEFLGLSVDSAIDFDSIERPFDTYSIVFVDQIFFHTLKTKENLRKLNCNIVLIGHFGKALPSEVDRGTIAVMMWPFQRAKVVKIVKAIAEPEPRGQVVKALSGLSVSDERLLADEFPLRILLAEDNMINIKVALQHLKKLGYHADSAKDGEEALTKCISAFEDERPYQVVLMDIQMPKKDGLAATLELRQEFRTRGQDAHLPYIVALTANVAGEDKQRSLEVGMVDFISKPILPEQLARVLRGLGQKIYKRG